MVTNRITKETTKKDHARWHAEHVAWARDIQEYERTIDAALFDVEVALWKTQYAKLDHNTPIDELECMQTALNDLATTLREHGDIMRAHEVAIMQHQDQLDKPPHVGKSDTPESGHRIMGIVHEDQRAFRERFIGCFNATLSILRNLLEKKSSVS